MHPRCLILLLKGAAMRNLAWILAGAMALVSPLVLPAESSPTGPESNHLPWTRLQGRLSLGSSSPSWQLGVEAPTAKLSSASLMGDYYFGPSFSGPGRLGGFRATSGLIIGPRNSLLSTGQPGSFTGSSF